MSGGYDGYLKFGTKIDQSGFESGVGKLTSVAKKGAKVAGAALAGVTTGLGVMAAAAVKVGSSFEEGMSKVSAVSGATGKDLEALTAKAEEMGAKTKFSATESAEALNYMAMAGWKTEDMLGGLEGIMNLAAASGEDLGSVSDIVTDALTAFGLEAGDAGHFADVLAKASSNSNTNVGMMGATFKYVAPLAGALGFDIEDCAVAIGLMANAGIKGEQAGTSLRAVLSRLAKPPKDAAQAMEDLGISITTADGQMRTLDDIVGDMRTSFSGLSQEQKATYAAMLGGQEAMSGLLAIVNASDSDFEKLQSAINDADGAALDMAETMQDNLKGQLTILGSSLEGLGIKVYDKFETPLKTATKSAIENVNDLTTSMTSGKLSGSVDKLATATGNFIAKAAELATKVLPKMINGLTWILDHGKLIASGIGAATAAVVTFKAVNKLDLVVKAWKAATVAVVAHEQAQRLMLVASNGGLTGMQTLVSVLTGKITLQAAATGVAAKAQIAWNGTLLANPIVLVTAGVVALTAALVIFGRRTDETAEKTKELTEATKESKEALDERQKAMKEQISSDVAEIENAKSLLDQLEKLTDANGKIIGDKERAKILIDEINAVMPDSIRWIDDETIAYQENSEAIRRQMDLKEAEIALEDMVAAKQEARKAIEESLKKQAELKEHLREVTEKLAEAEKIAAENPMWAGAASNVIELKKQVADIEKTLATEQEAVRVNAETIDQYTQLKTAIAEQNFDEMNRILNGLTQGWKDHTNAQAVELGAQLDQQREMHQLLCKAYEETGSESIRQMRDSMEAEIETTQQEISLLAQGLGEAISTGAASGVMAQAPLVIASVSKMALDAVMAGKKSIESNSPSKLSARLIGLPIPQGVAVGIKAAAPEVYSAMSNTMTAAVEKTKNSLGAFSVIGALISSGIAKGTVDAKSKYYTAIETMSAGAMAKAKEKAKSYKEVGSIYVEQMTKGINDRADDAIKAVEKMVDEQIEAEKKAREKGEKELQEQITNTKNKNAKKQLQDQLERLKTQNDTEITRLKEIGKEQVAAYSDSIKTTAAEQITSIKDTVGALADEFQKKYDDIIAKRDSMQEKLADYGDMFTLDRDNVKLADWDVQTTSLNRYNDALTELKQKLQDHGLSEDLLNEVTKLGPKEGTLFAEKLLAQSDTDFDLYVNGWTEKQALAKQIAEQFYQDQLTSLETEFAGKLDESLAGVPDTVEGIGRDAMQGFISGMDGMMGSAVSKARQIAQAVIRAYREEFDIHSPSKKMEKLVGVPVGQGIGVGMEKSMQEVYAKMRRSVAYETGRIAAQTTAKANHASNVEANSARTETYYQNNSTEKLMGVKIEGDMAVFARKATPYIINEIKRQGGNLVKGAGANV